MPGVADHQCDQKWQNLKKNSKKNVDGQKKRGSMRKTRREFCEEKSDVM